MKRRKSLSNTLMIYLSLLGITLVISLSAVIGVLYKKAVISQSNSTVTSFCKAASDFIDGDTIKTYSQTGETDDYYFQVEKFLTVLQQDTNVLYYYVYIPEEDSVKVIWDIDNSDGIKLGQEEEYPEGSKEYCQQMFTKDPEIETFIAEDEEYGDIATASYPIFDASGDPVALVGVDIELPGVREIFFAFILTASLTAIFIILITMVVYYFMVRKKVIVPLKKLDEAAKHMVKSIDADSDTKLNIDSDNELGELAESFEQMGDELKDYINQLSKARTEKEKSDAELNVATQIQSDMLPSIFPAFPRRKEFDLYASMHPAKEVGGDFYDFYMIDRDHLCLVIADVSGKSVPAALFMVIAKTLIKNKATQCGSPSETLAYVNDQLCDNNKADMFVTVWIGMLQLSTGILTASNGGHEYPIIYRHSSDHFELFNDKHCFVLGAMEQTRYSDYTVQLYEGDRLFVYTDGIPEAINSETVQYSTERMISELDSNKDEDAQTLLGNMYRSVTEFANGVPQFDDITMLCMSYYGHKDL